MSVYPLNFAFPQTPKTEECTALKHHHEGDKAKATQHFESKLQQIFAAIEQQTNGVISIMFAHQSTEAWTTLCNSVLGARMNITSSWSIDSERANRSLGLAGAVLASSVTVACRPATKEGYGDYKTVKKAIKENVRKEVKFLYEMGFRGADLLTACFGQAVSEFGKYKSVEKANGNEVSVGELLDMAREAAFNAIISDIDTDDATKFYIGWLNLFGFTAAEHDNVRRITQIGLNIDLQALQAAHILVQEGKQQNLATSEQRSQLSSRLGQTDQSYAIDEVHQVMALFGGSTRRKLLQYIRERATDATGKFWRVANAIIEVLPPDSADYKLIASLIAEKDNLIREAKNTTPEQQSVQGDLGF